MSGAKERIMQMLDHFKIRQAPFEKKVGISNGYINNLKGSIGSEIIAKIAKAFPEVDPIWLLTGDGNMLKGDVIQNTGSAHIGTIHGRVGDISQKIDNSASSDKIANLDAENKRLRAEVERLRKQNEKLLDQNMKLTNKLLA